MICTGRRKLLKTWLFGHQKPDEFENDGSDQN